MGALHVKSAMLELSKSEKGDEVDSVKLSDLLHGRHFKGAFVVQQLHIASSIIFPEIVMLLLCFWQWCLLAQSYMLSNSYLA